MCRGPFPAFNPRFVGKCDPQSRDLTQLSLVVVVRLTNNYHCSSCWMHTWDNVSEKYSRWFLKNVMVFECFSGIWSRHLRRREQSLYQLGHTTLINYTCQTFIHTSKDELKFERTRHPLKGERTHPKHGHSFSIGLIKKW